MGCEGAEGQVGANQGEIIGKLVCRLLRLLLHWAMLWRDSTTQSEHKQQTDQRHLLSPTLSLAQLRLRGITALVQSGAMRGGARLVVRKLLAQNRGEVRAAMSGEGDLGESGREVRDSGGQAGKRRVLGCRQVIQQGWCACMGWLCMG